MRFFLLALIALVSFGCDREADKPLSDEEKIGKLFAERPKGEMADRDLEVIRWLLADRDSDSGESIYFLTPTPMRQWREDGNWESFSPEFHGSLSDLKTQYQPAQNAYLSQENEDRIFEKKTDAEGWMKWITILKWNSPTEVVVNEGVWSGELAGGEFITTYEKIGGSWSIKGPMLSRNY